MSIEAVKGKTALVTGASRGIGRQISLALAKLGCNQVLHSRDASNSDAVAKEVRDCGVEAYQVGGELSDQTQVDAMLEQALKEAGKIDLLFNNAAIQAGYYESPWETPAEDYRKSFEVNVISLARICYKLAPLMIEAKWGRIVNVTSGVADNPSMMAYATSKAAVDKFVRDFAPTFKDTGVMMNLLDPGWLKTDLGGDQAPNEVTDVIPGALVPGLLDDGISGRLFRAMDYAGQSLEQALAQGAKVEK
jgi:3-oxoacyl-[acyl-carrier protein] reductase